MKPKVLLVYKDRDDYDKMFKCIENRYGVTKRQRFDFIESEHILFRCVKVNCNSNHIRGFRHDFIYLSDSSIEVLTNEFRNYCFAGLFYLEKCGFSLGYGDKNE